MSEVDYKFNSCSKETFQYLIKQFKSGHLDIQEYWKPGDCKNIKVTLSSGEEVEVTLIINLIVYAPYLLVYFNFKYDSETAEFEDIVEAIENELGLECKIPEWNVKGLYRTLDPDTLGIFQHSNHLK